MAEGAFNVFRDEEDQDDIHFQLASAEVAEIPEDQAQLRNEVERALVVIRSAFASDRPRFERYFRSLLSLAQAGLVGPVAQPKISLQALAGLKEDIVAREAGRIKNMYMRTLGVRALILGGPALIAGLGIRVWLPEYTVAAHFLLLWAGCMAGVWLSFGARKTIVGFDNLHILEEDRLEPVVRLLFAGFLTVVLGLLFITRAVVVNVGELSTIGLATRLDVALLAGLLCGVSEQALSVKVTSQASALLSFGK